MSYEDFNRKHRRLSILLHLSEAPQYTANASILADVLNNVGLPSTYDQVVTELVWLKENGFVDYVDHGSVVVATTTRSGVEIAQGIGSHPDIQKPKARR